MGTMEASEGEAQPVVVIAGGGIAGIEALLALTEHAREFAEIKLLSPDPAFSYRPLLVEEPFAGEPVREHELAPICEKRGAELIRGELASVDTASRTATLGDGTELSYDHLIVCVGARPGHVVEGATPVEMRGRPLDIGSVIEAGAGGEADRVAFAIPPGPAWPLPAYELALMTALHARRGGHTDLAVSLITPEDQPLANFGPEASTAVAELLAARRVDFEGNSYVSAYDGGTVTLAPGERTLAVSELVAMPALHGPAIPGLPADGDGFIPVDDHGRVQGAEGVWCAGDGSNYPLKHGGVGTQLADTAAESIAAELGAPIEASPFTPVLRGRLLTGGEPLSLEAEVEGDRDSRSSYEYLWWPPHKVSGKYLSPFIGGETEVEPPHPGTDLEVELTLPGEWHDEPLDE